MSLKKPTAAQLAQKKNSDDLFRLTVFLSENGYGQIGDNSVDVAIKLIKESSAAATKLRETR